MGMIIALTRHIAAEDAAVRAGGWQHTIGPGLAGRTLGIVGLGRLGIPVAGLARAFQMEVLAWSPNLTAERAEPHGVRAVTKDELFERSDIVSIHMPLSDRSRGLIGAGDLGRLGPSSYLVNTSRGPIVDEAALVDALRSGAIAGAALDVYDTEPLPRTIRSVVAEHRCSCRTSATSRPTSYRISSAMPSRTSSGCLAGATVRVLS